jgi:hypothetical protein
MDRIWLVKPADFSGYTGKPPSLFELRRVRKAGKGRAKAKRRRIPPLFGDESLKTVCFDSFILKNALKQTRSVCLRAN